MEYLVPYLPIWATLLPIIGAIMLFFVEHRYSTKIRDAFTISITAVTFITVLLMYKPLVDTGLLYISSPLLFPPFGISFRVDMLSFILAFITSLIWMLVTFYSVEYMSHEQHANRYYPFVLISLGGSMGTVLTGDLFSLFFFFELMSIASYVLVIHEETPMAMQAGYRYIILTLVGGLALFFGIVITFELTSSVSIVQGHLITTYSPLALIAFVAYLIGFGMKAGMFPLHVWLPEAHPVAPSPASALLSGIMIKTGAYGLIRVFFNIYDPALISAYSWDKIVMVLAAITILLGSAAAVVQTDIKRRLAYSSIGQMGYILLGLSLLNENGLIGNIFHIFSHALMKSTLFLTAGIIIYKTGKRDIRELGGIGIKMPITMGAFTVAALAMIGIPPLNGFLSKWVLALGALDANQPGFVFLLILSSMLNAIYYLPIIISAFFGHHHGSNLLPITGKEASLWMLVPIVILASSCLLLNILPINFPLDLSKVAAKILL